MTAERVPASWLAVLEPLPAHAVLRRSPVAEVGPDSPIFGWTSITVDCSDVPFGTRIVLVTLDAAGQLLSASDHVHLRDVDAAGHSPTPRVHMRQFSLGGRFEEDGFQGTYWSTEGPEPTEDEEPQWQMTPRPPTEDEIARLRAVIDDVLSRGA